MAFLILIFASFAAALISGAAGFGGALLLLPVVTMCPGYFETELTIDTLKTDGFKNYIKTTVPMGRYGGYTAV